MSEQGGSWYGGSNKNWFLKLDVGRWETVDGLSSDACLRSPLGSRQPDQSPPSFVLRPAESDHKTGSRVAIDRPDSIRRQSFALPRRLRSAHNSIFFRHPAHRALPVPYRTSIINISIIQEMSSRGGKLAPEVNRALFVKNLSYNVTPEELFDLFGKFGPIRQVRQGIASNTKGTAFVVYEDVMDAKQACDKLNGFNFQNRYLVGALTSYQLGLRSSNPPSDLSDVDSDFALTTFPVLYHQPDKMVKSKEDLEARRESLAQLKKQHGID
ncbi:hypothetical protein ACJZ2D_003133 [Fusarium nematophilum]